MFLILLCSHCFNCFDAHIIAATLALLPQQAQHQQAQQQPAATAVLQQLQLQNASTQPLYVSCEKNLFKIVIFITQGLSHRFGIMPLR